MVVQLHELMDVGISSVWPDTSVYIMYSSHVMYSGHAQVCKIARKIKIFEPAVAICQDAKSLFRGFALESGMAAWFELHRHSPDSIYV